MSTAPDSAPDPPAASRGRNPLPAWRTLDVAQRRTAAAAVVVLVTLFLPWYSTETVAQGRGGALARSTGTMTGLGAFSFVEAAIVLVLLALLALTWGRATRRSFSLPFDDGTIAFAAAVWVGLLVVYRLFAKPGGSSGPQVNTLIGLTWGIFVSLVAVGLLLAAGLDQRRRAPERGREQRRRRQAADDARPVVDPRTVVADRGEDQDDGTYAWPTRERYPDRSSDGRPREASPAPRPERPDRAARRPASADDATLHLGREAATRILRDEGLGAPDPAGPEDAEAATRQVDLGAADPTADPSAAEPPTRRLPPPDDVPPPGRRRA